MKRNAIVRITLWSIVLLVLLATFFILLYVSGSGRSMRNDPPPESIAAVPLPRVTSPKDGNAIVTGECNVYSEPDEGADIVAYAERGQMIHILRTEEIGSKQWGYIGSPTLGWIDMHSVELLEPGFPQVEAPTEAPGKPENGQYNAMVLSDELNIRTTPSTMSPVAGMMEKGAQLQITRQEQVDGISWGYTPAPVKGWVVMEYVELLEPLEESKTVIDLPAPQKEKTEGNAITLDAASIRNMEIEWAVGTIRIQPKDITEIRITEEGVNQAEKPMVWKVQNEKLAIQYAEDMKISLGMEIRLKDVSKDLTIEVPMDWQCDSLEITAAAASLEVRDLTIREMEFDGASGTCTFENCTIEKLDLDTASGDVHFNGSLQQLDCDAASADIVLSLNNIPKNLDMDTASGDLNLTFPADAGFTVIMDTLSGDFESDFDTTLRNGSYVAGNGRCRIEVDAMSGDVTIRKAS